MERFTNSGVAAILGMPDCWCSGGVAGRVMKRVVAPGVAWTTVGATGFGRCASAGFGTTLALAWLPSRVLGTAFGPGKGSAFAGAAEAAARAASCCFASGGRFWYSSHFAERAGAGTCCASW